MDDNNRQNIELIRSELIQFFQSESRSEEAALHEIFQRHGLDTNDESNYDSILAVCRNKRVAEGINQCVLEYFTADASSRNDGWTPLHLACKKKSVTCNIIRLFIDTAPNSVRSINNEGRMPLHILCSNSKLDETNAIKILKLLIEKHPVAVRHADNDGELPIHHASASRSHEFCRVLIEAYPGSERMTDGDGELPLHCACFRSTLGTVKYLYGLYPAAIVTSSAGGHYPIHYAMAGIHVKRDNDNPIDHVETVKFLLDCDPNVKFQKYEGMSLLRLLCGSDYDVSTIDVGIQNMGAIYDVHPEAIEDDTISSVIQHCHEQVQDFINGELVYSRQARELPLTMMTPDDNGRLPLHRALQDNVRLGSIKLLVKGNPHALHSSDIRGTLPLHVACEHHDSTNVIQYLVELDTTSLGAVDRDGNTALHYACRASARKYETIALLLEKYDAASVSKRNVQKKLPIELLWENNEVEDRESVEYIESIFRLLKAYPETLTIFGTELQSFTAASQKQSGNGKKRKFGDA